MTMQMLECFLAVAKTNSFSQAADQLYMSQPTLSRHIAALETELGTKLFIRSKNTVRLSNVGLSVRGKLEEMYQYYLNASKEVHSTVNDIQDGLKIGIIENGSIDSIVRDALQTLHNIQPGLVLTFRKLDPKQCVSALRDHIIDIFLTSDDIMPELEEMSRCDLAEDIICLAVPADHPHAHMTKVFCEDMQQYFRDLPLIVVDHKLFEDPVRSAMDNRFPSYAFLSHANPKFITEEETWFPSILHQIELGFAYSIMPGRAQIGNSPYVSMIPIYLHTPEGNACPMAVKNIAVWEIENGNRMLQILLDILKQSD